MYSGFSREYTKPYLKVSQKDSRFLCGLHPESLSYLDQKRLRAQTIPLLQSTRTEFFLRSIIFL